MKEQWLSRLCAYVCLLPAFLSVSLPSCYQSAHEMEPSRVGDDQEASFPPLSCQTSAPSLDVQWSERDGRYHLEIDSDAPVYAIGYGTNVDDPADQTAPVSTPPQSLEPLGGLHPQDAPITFEPHVAANACDGETILIASNGYASTAMTVVFTPGQTPIVTPLGSTCMGIGGTWEVIKKIMRGLGVGARKAAKIAWYLIALGVTLEVGCMLAMASIIAICGNGQAQSEIDCRCNSMRDQPASSYLAWDVREDAKKMGCGWAN